jgi:DNA-binding MarR family transcriptional regulator
MMKEREYRLLQAISEDEEVTQAGLAAQLGIAVGSVNWYIKRLVKIGYLKATRMDRNRLQYNLTPEGLAALAQRATRYFGDALKVYNRLRKQAKHIVQDMQSRQIERVWLRGKGETMDIMRLTCIEAGIELDERAGEWCIKDNGYGYELYRRGDGDGGER